MRKSKKGITLVELVIACVIMVLLGGACTAVIVSGQKIFISGSEMANNQLEANVLQTAVVNALPKMINVEKKTVDQAKATTEGVALFYDGDTLTIRQNGSNMTIEKVNGLTYEFKRVGKASSDPAIPETARAQFVYHATLEDGSSITGGLVLTNTKYASVLAAGLSTEAGAVKLKDIWALYFTIPAEDPGT